MALRWLVKLLLIALLAWSFVTLPQVSQAQKKDAFTLGLSLYTGWMPWYLADENGVLAKWAASRGITIKVKRINDYGPSLEAYVAGDVDALVITNMDALMSPVNGGIDSTVLAIGDFSNGNDKVLTRDDIAICDIPQHKVLIFEESVSEYMLNRAFVLNKCKTTRFRPINAMETEIENGFREDAQHKVAVTWNPPAMRLALVPGVTSIFDSSMIPGEILDMVIVRTDRLDPRFAEALLGAWYEVLGVISQRGSASKKAKGLMASLSGVDPGEFEAQLRTTAMLWTPQSALEFTKSPELKKTMTLVRDFLFQRGLLGEEAENADVVGIEYPDGSIQGHKRKILRFNASYLEKAASGQITR